MRTRRKLSAATRRKLRALILARQPWKLSTGPRTEAGKTVSSMNSITHARTSRVWQAWRAAKRAERLYRLGKGKAEDWFKASDEFRRLRDLYGPAIERRRRAAGYL